MKHSRIPICPSPDVLAWILTHWTIIPETGIVINRKEQTIGAEHNSGYVQLRAQNGKQIDRSIRRTHLIWWKFYGQWPTFEIDHKDRIRTNDSISNLKASTPTLNEANKDRYLLNPRSLRTLGLLEGSQSVG